MHTGELRLWIRLSAAAVSVMACFVVFTPTVHAGAADNVYGWAWSGTIGWISMNCKQTYPFPDSDTCGDVDYGVTLQTTPGFVDRADISGYAWSETIGWICFGASCSGTTPEGGSPYAQYRSVLDAKDDQFVGWAQVVALGTDGWISLNCENLDECGSSNYRVELNDQTGEFYNASFASKYGWSGNDDGTGIGWVSFAKTRTTWTLSNIGILRRPQGVYEPVAAGLSGTHLHTFLIGFADLSAPEGFMLSCDVKRADGSLLRLRSIFPETARHSNDEGLSYTVQPADPVLNNKPWIIDGCAIAAFGSTTVCTDDTPCGATGICDPIDGVCREIVDSTSRRRPIFTHDNDWTGLDADEDQYRAIKCTAGFPGQYFKNAQLCDFTGDASFALAMRKSVPIEGDCGDGIDNDGNGQIDCADRYCQGLSYLCKPHPPTTCISTQAGDGIIDCDDGAYIFGDLCCTQQPVASGSTFSHIVDGLECVAGDPQDGYFDCSCTTQGAFDASPTDDCFSPGYQNGDLCCSADDEVISIIGPT